jgi:hypothetical protein
MSYYPTKVLSAAMPSADPKRCVNAAPNAGEMTTAMVKTIPQGGDIEGLEQKRPIIFDSAAAEAGFCFAMFASVVITVRISILSPPLGGEEQFASGRLIK